MSNLTNVADVIPDADISPTCIDESGVASFFAGKSFTVQTRPSKTEERAMNPLPPFQVGNWNQQTFTSRQIQASTPPPDETPVAQSQLVTGAGGLFSSLPSSRASSLSSLTVRSEISSDSPTTPFRGNGDNLTTPVVLDKATGRGFLFSLDTLFTPPDSTPKLKGKRIHSPPPSPRPLKLAKFDRFRMSNLLEDDEGYSEELPTKLDHQQIFRNPQKRLFAVAEFCPGSPSSQADIFGNPPVEDSDSKSDPAPPLGPADNWYSSGREWLRRRSHRL